MSRMSELYMEVEELMLQDLTGAEIAERLSLDVDMVYDMMDALEEENSIHDFDETDDAYALASAGFGTDEDYGYYGDE